jgi:hypothetical protein
VPSAEESVNDAAEEDDSSVAKLGRETLLGMPEPVVA